MGASPRLLPGEDPIRRRRAEADETTSIFLSVVVGEPTAWPGRRSRPAPQAIGHIRQAGETANPRVRSPVRPRRPEPTMEKITISVLRIQGGWRVLKNSRPVGDYDYRVDAEEAGLALTRDIHLSGREVELLVQHDGSHEIEPMTGWRTVH